MTTQVATLPTRPGDVRELIRQRDFTGITAGVSPRAFVDLYRELGGTRV